MSRPHPETRAGHTAKGGPRHESFMQQALAEARRARHLGEVPVGAVLVLGERVVGHGFNQPIQARDPTAHAEVVALRRAAKKAGNYRLTGSTLYVTIEPCLMCVGALVHARVSTLVYGAVEPKAGAIRSVLNIESLRLNHRFRVVAGVLEPECRQLLVDFFKFRREQG
ncbi:MAG TPA: tRNA adenosine(34) deaminase TadA [Vicinamibacteria bacterium]|nr:tRNA adenosine(34) deaminase TadA [Vicinamibacteria bacterium]